MIDLLDAPGLEALRKRWNLDPHELRRFRRRMLKDFAGPAAALESLPERARGAFEAEVRLRHLTQVDRRDSSQDGSSKLLYETSDGLRIESVILRIASGRTTLCVSSQVGCAVGCDFCATGALGLKRNLSAAEILEQLLQAGELLRAEGRRVRNIVYMGMGEPLHNEEGVYRSLEELSHPNGCDHSLARVTLSSVGIPAAMLRCVKRFPKLRFALSLHTARQEARDALIPFGSRFDVAELRAASLELTRFQEQSLMIEYVMLAGLTDTPEDLQALLGFVEDMPVMINLLPFNALPADAGKGLKPSSAQRIQSFAQSLKQAGLHTTIRHSLGGDSAAACGQLAGS